MACQGCSDKKESERYMGTPQAEVGRTTHSTTKAPESPHFHEDVSFDTINSYSLDTLTAMRRDIHIREEAHARDMLSKMSDDLKAFQILTYVSIANGEEFSPQGYSPEHCITLLYKMLGFEETGKIFDKFPGLKEQIIGKYGSLQSNKINIFK